MESSRKSHKSLLMHIDITLSPTTISPVRPIPCDTAGIEVACTDIAAAGIRIWVRLGSIEPRHRLAQEKGSIMRSGRAMPVLLLGA